MQDDTAYHVFYILSRVIVIFAIIVLITGLIIRFKQNKPNIQSFVTNQKPTVVFPSGQNSIETVSTSAAELNLKGPFICNFSSPEASVSAFVKDNNAYGQIKKKSVINNVLLNDDCLYFWKSFSFEGEKLCGLSPYISIFGQLPVANFLGNSLLLKNQSMLPININMIPSILNSCKKKEIKNNNVFILPKGINFKLL